MTREQLHAARARDVEHRVGIRERERHRLLDDHVLAGAHRGDRAFGVLRVRRADPHGVGVARIRHKRDLRHVRRDLGDGSVRAAAAREREAQRQGVRSRSAS